MSVVPHKAVTSPGCLIMHPSLKNIFFGAAFFRISSGICDILVTILSDSKSSCFVDELDLWEIARRHSEALVINETKK